MNPSSALEVVPEDRVAEPNVVAEEPPIVEILGSHTGETDIYEVTEDRQSVQSSIKPIFDTFDAEVEEIKTHIM